MQPSTYRNGLIVALAVLCAGCVSPASLGVKPQRWQTMTSAEKKQLSERFEKIQRYRADANQPEGSAVIQVQVKGGQALMPPDFLPYRFSPVQIDLPSKSCKNVTLYSLSGQHQTALGVCYINNILSLDPSRTQLKDWQGTLFFHSNPIWQQGFTYYGMNSSGYAQLSGVNVSVKALSQKRVVHD